MANTYSPSWFDLFLHPLPPEQTQREVAFVARQCPRPAHQSLRDICCGPGRHAGPLAEMGYRVTGADIDRAQIELGRQTFGNAVTWVELDMRRLDGLPDRYDAVICLWQSFGFFGDETNADVLHAMRDRLSPGGRLILDVYHRTFFEHNQGTRTFDRASRTIVERKRLDGGRLSVELTYGGGESVDRFDWRLYTPEELEDLARTVGLEPLLTCRAFDESLAADASAPRMQLVFRRP